MGKKHCRISPGPLMEKYAVHVLEGGGKARVTCSHDLEKAKTEAA
jgi:hypothetical protein